MQLILRITAGGPFAGWRTKVFLYFVRTTLYYVYVLIFGTWLFPVSHVLIFGTWFLVSLVLIFRLWLLMNDVADRRKAAVLEAAEIVARESVRVRALLISYGNSLWVPGRVGH